MGKGTIVSSLGDGQYTVTLNRNITRITNRLTWIASRLTALVDIMADDILAVAAAKSTYDDELAKLHNIIDDMKAHPEQRKEYEKQLEAQTKVILDAQKAWQAALSAQASHSLEQTSLTKEQTMLQAADVQDPTIAAWCADYTKDLTGEVGTIEVPGDSVVVNIKPGYENGEAYDATTDGQLMPTKNGTPASIYYNWAMFPGWQKWKPTYRFGVITAIDYLASTCTVDLDAALSDARQIDINQTDTLSNVPITYMACNGAAFEAGDSVIVKFTDQDWAHPVVIGFKDNPKPCPSGIYAAYFQKDFTPGAGLTADDVYAREYFKIGSDGKTPAWTTEEEVASKVIQKDIWSEITVRHWDYYTWDHGANCNYAEYWPYGYYSHHEGAGVGYYGRTVNSGFSFRLPPNDKLVGIATTDIDVIAWSEQNSKNIATSFREKQERGLVIDGYNVGIIVLGAQHGYQGWGGYQIITFGTDYSFLAMLALEDEYENPESGRIHEIIADWTNRRDVLDDADVTDSLITITYVWGETKDIAMLWSGGEAGWSTLPWWQLPYFPPYPLDVSVPYYHSSNYCAWLTTDTYTEPSDLLTNTTGEADVYRTDGIASYELRWWWDDDKLPENHLGVYLLDVRPYKDRSGNQHTATPHVRVDTATGGFVIYAKIFYMFGLPWDLLDTGLDIREARLLTVTVETDGTIASATLSDGSIPETLAPNTIYDSVLLPSDVVTSSFKQWHDSLGLYGTSFKAFLEAKRDSVAPDGLTVGVCRLLEKVEE